MLPPKQPPAQLSVQSQGLQWSVPGLKGESAALDIAETCELYKMVKTSQNGLKCTHGRASCGHCVASKVASSRMGSTVKSYQDTAAAQARAGTGMWCCSMSGKPGWRFGFWKWCAEISRQSAWSARLLIVEPQNLLWPVLALTPHWCRLRALFPPCIDQLSKSGHGLNPHHVPWRCTASPPKTSSIARYRKNASDLGRTCEQYVKVTSLGIQPSLVRSHWWNHRRALALPELGINAIECNYSPRVLLTTSYLTTSCSSASYGCHMVSDAAPECPLSLLCNDNLQGFLLGGGSCWLA